MRWFTHKFCLFAFIALSVASTFGTACPLGPPCLDLNTQIKGSRLPSWGVDSGSANAYAITTIADIGSGRVLQTGSRFMFIATHANTSASTLAVDGGSAIAIKKNVSTPLASGDIALNQVIEVTYDGTNFQLVGNGALSFANISGSLACSQMPALTGDVTSSAGSCATTLATVTVPKGGTGQTTLTAHNFVLGEGASAVGFLSLAAHQVPVGATSADPSAKTVPDCQDTSGNHLNFTQSTDLFSCGTSSSGGGGGSSSGPGFIGTHCTASRGGAAATFSCASTFDVVASEELVMACHYYTNGAGAGTLTPSDTLSLSWTQRATTFDTGSSRGVTVWTTNSGGSTGPDTCTCTSTVNMSFGGISVNGLVGATSGSPVDASATTHSNAAANVALALTTTTANDALFMFAEYGGAATLTGYSFTFFNDTGQALVDTYAPAGVAATYYRTTTFSAAQSVVALAIH